MSSRTGKRPTPASESTVERAVAAFRSAERGSSAAAHTFLDRIGLVGLHDPAAMVAFSNPAARALRTLIPGDPHLAAAVLERVTACVPAEPPAGPAAIAYLYFAQTAGRAIREIPGDWDDAPRLLKNLSAEMALHLDYASHGLCAALLSHPACPAEVLYQAAVAWPVEDARVAASNPAASDEVRVVAALRS